MSARPEPAAELTALVGKRRGLRVRFYWSGDRYLHVVEGINRDEGTALLESVEDNGDAHWPPSPPFQHLHAGQQMIMMTGAAGTSHWSVSVSVEPLSLDDDGDLQFERPTTSGETYLLFDVACRLKLPPEWLGSSYRVRQGIPSDQLGSSAFAGGCFIAWPRMLSNPSGAAENPECVVKASQAESGTKLVHVVASRQHSIETPATVRWRYGMFWGMS